MTYQEIKESNKRYLTSDDVKDILECSQYSITLQAREGNVPFPCLCIGTRVKFPRYGFLQYCENVLGLNQGF